MLDKIYAKFFIWYWNLSRIRSDRGAIEYAAVTQLAKQLWKDNDFNAISIGRFILWDSEESMKNDKILKHELCHCEQYKKYGVIGFKILYLFEQAKNGYKNNRFEIEALEAEKK
jgi:hypothetical protein